MEFYLDLGAVNEEATKMNSAGGGAKFFSRKKIAANSDVDIRILPPVKSLNGLFYLKVTSFWVNKKNYISAATFGEPCVGLQYVKAIEASNNAEAKALLASKSFTIQEEYELPILLLDRTSGQTKVIDECVKTFDCTWGLIKKFNNLVSHRNYQNGSPLGIMDPAKGFNITVSKSVVADKTNYDAMVIPMAEEIDAKYCLEIPDIVENNRKKLVSQAYLKGVFDAYFTGTPMPDESIKNPLTNTTQAAPVVVAQPVAPVQPVVAAQPAPVVEPAPVVTPAQPAVTGGSLLDRLNAQ